MGGVKLGRQRRKSPASVASPSEFAWLAKGFMNIHTTKKNCNRCAAGRHNRCELGYLAIWKAYDDHGFTVFGTPQEPCPKPRTNADFLYANKWYRKRS